MSPAYVVAKAGLLLAGIIGFYLPMFDIGKRASYV